MANLDASWTSNASCLREPHYTPAPFDMVSGVPVHSFKTVADAFWGFHQVELQEESKCLTTFITHGVASSIVGHP